jgi:hypothetical protein
MRAVSSTLTILLVNAPNYDFEALVARCGVVAGFLDRAVRAVSVAHYSWFVSVSPATIESTVPELAVIEAIVPLITAPLPPITKFVVSVAPTRPPKGEQPDGRDSVPVQLPVPSLFTA